jgi:hypothetical protein
VDEVGRQRLSAVAHATSTMWGPISEATVDDVVERVASFGIGPGTRVLDLTTDRRWPKLRVKVVVAR